MTRLEIGDVLEDRYRIDRPIARGGMSTVYRCVDMRLGRQVAAKVMDERYDDDPVFIKRFSREARAMARLQHPNLVAIHDFSADGEPIYLIMELIDGGTLRELLAEGGPLTVPAALSTLRSVLQGLTEVHSTGLIHRDIKPDNVLITSHHRVKLGDFGLVRARNAQATSNMIVGTVSYLAPEQVTGEDITPATDVYSAGIVLFELLTGTVPFSGDTPIAHATARLYADVPAPSTRGEDVPKLVDALVATATARDPRERFADAEEFLDALEDICRELDLPTVTIPVPRNAAAARTAQTPTDYSGIGATDVFEPTRTIPQSATEHLDGGPTEVIPPEPDPQQPDFKTRLDVPKAPVPPEPPLPPAPAPASAPVPAPAPAAGVGKAHSPAQSPAQVAEEEPAERPLTNRHPASLLVFLLAVVVATGAVAISGWWFGSSYYEGTPSLWV
ncbi:serine/threonine-protein kinase [Corynebacterium rhinophilum]|uniref:serine/threonine-protein kinase n=1 Tax=Corynebacterium rhinophilum TaxID=3050197 RepID=UPI00254E35FC|nr:MULTISPECIES: serine/threonine-protein kinase [unclassified Corynebacterium]MDK8453546.1 serine/threonine-protein kinase [Corynebacterium sp. MSK084]MDK8491046.1 serine/threonine-protein kinase [Corynebacterium sp. MSK175]MDK8515476.1 serine/threonine-protein kinase [Corynebacterium sp. MSK123]MDK8548652.1 serine/threonine-protein kinase [Corynebacterium sp. MSK222]